MCNHSGLIDRTRNFLLLILFSFVCCSKANRYFHIPSCKTFLFLCTVKMQNHHFIYDPFLSQNARTMANASRQTSALVLRVSLEPDASKVSYNDGLEWKRLVKLWPFALGKTLSFTKTRLSLYYFTEFKV